MPIAQAKLFFSLRNVDTSEGNNDIFTLYPNCAIKSKSC